MAVELTAVVKFIADTSDLKRVGAEIQAAAAQGAGATVKGRPVSPSAEVAGSKISVDLAKSLSTLPKEISSAVEDGVKRGMAIANKQGGGGKKPPQEGGGGGGSENPPPRQPRGQQGGIFGSDARGGRQGGLLDRAKSVAEYTAAAMVVRGGFDAFGKAVSTIANVQGELQQLNKVLNITGSELESLKASAMSTAKEFGKTTTDVLAGYKVFAQMGKTPTEVKSLGRTVALASNVSSLGTEELSTMLASTMLNFKKSIGNNSQSIIDSVLAVEGASAVSEKDLFDVLRRIGPQASALGMNPHELNALTTVIKERTMAPSEEIATSLRFMLRNLSNPKIGKKLEAMFGKEAIQFFTPSGDINDTFKVFQNLASLYPTLSKSRQASLAGIVAETRHVPKFTALMQGFNRTNDVMALSQNSSGEAMRRNAIVMEDIRKQAAKTGAAFEAFSVAFGSNLIGPASTFLKILERSFNLLEKMSSVRIFGSEPGSKLEEQGLVQRPKGMMEQVTGGTLGGVASLAAIPLLLMGGAALLKTGAAVKGAVQGLGRMGLKETAVVGGGALTGKAAADAAFARLTGKEVATGVAGGGATTVGLGAKGLMGSLGSTIVGLFTGNIIGNLVGKALGGMLARALGSAAVGTAIGGPIGTIVGFGAGMAISAAAEFGLGRVMETPRQESERKGFSTRLALGKEEEQTATTITSIIDSINNLSTEFDTATAAVHKYASETGTSGTEAERGALNAGLITRGGAEIKSEQKGIVKNLDKFFTENYELLKRVAPNNVGLNKEGQVIYTRGSEKVGPLSENLPQAQKLATKMVNQSKIDKAVGDFGDRLVSVQETIQDITSADPKSSLNKLLNATARRWDSGQKGQVGKVDTGWKAMNPASWFGPERQWRSWVPFVGGQEQGSRSRGMTAEEIRVAAEERKTGAVSGEILAPILHDILTALKAGKGKDILGDLKSAKESDRQALMELATSDLERSKQATALAGGYGPEETFRELKNRTFRDVKREMSGEQAVQIATLSKGQAPEESARFIQGAKEGLDILVKDLATKTESVGKIGPSGDVLLQHQIQKQTPEGVVEATVSQSADMKDLIKLAQKGKIEIQLTDTEQGKKFLKAVMDAEQKFASVGFGSGQVLAETPNIKLGPTRLSDLPAMIAGSFRGYNEKGMPQFSKPIQEILSSIEATKNKTKEIVTEGKTATEIGAAAAQQVEAARIVDEAANIFLQAVSGFGKVVIAIDTAAQKMEQFTAARETAKILKEPGLFSELGPPAEVQLSKNKNELNPQERAQVSGFYPIFAKLKEIAFSKQNLGDVITSTKLEQRAIEKSVSEMTNATMGAFDVDKLKQAMEGLPLGAKEQGDVISNIEALIKDSNLQTLNPDRAAIGGQISKILTDSLQSMQARLGGEATTLNTDQRELDRVAKAATALSQLQQSAEEASRSLANLEKFGGLYKNMNPALGEGPFGVLGSNQPIMFNQDKQGNLSQLDFKGMNKFEQQRKMLDILSSQDVRRGRNKIVDEQGNVMSPLTDKQVEFQKKVLTAQENAAKSTEKETTKRDQLKMRKDMAYNTVQGIQNVLDNVADLPKSARSGLQALQTDLLNLNKLPARAFYKPNGEVNLESTDIVKSIGPRFGKIMEDLNKEAQKNPQVQEALKRPELQWMNNALSKGITKEGLQAMQESTRVKDMYVNAATVNIGGQKASTNAGLPGTPGTVTTNTNIPTTPTARTQAAIAGAEGAAATTEVAAQSVRDIQEKSVKFRNFSKLAPNSENLYAAGTTEVPGSISLPNGNRLIATKLPEKVQNLYSASGNTITGPGGQQLANTTQYAQSYETAKGMGERTIYPNKQAMQAGVQPIPQSTIYTNDATGGIMKLNPQTGETTSFIEGPKAVAPQVPVTALEGQKQNLLTEPSPASVQQQVSVTNKEKTYPVTGNPEDKNLIFPNTGGWDNIQAQNMRNDNKLSNDLNQPPPVLKKETQQVQQQASTDVSKQLAQAGDAAGSSIAKAFLEAGSAVAKQISGSLGEAISKLSQSLNSNQSRPNKNEGPGGNQPTDEDVIKRIIQQEVSGISETHTESLAKTTADLNNIKTQLDTLERNTQEIKTDSSNRASMSDLQDLEYKLTNLSVGSLKESDVRELVGNKVSREDLEALRSLVLDAKQEASKAADKASQTSNLDKVVLTLQSKVNELESRANSATKVFAA